MSLKKFFLRSKITYKIYLYYNIYIRHKAFQKRNQYSQWGEDKQILNFFKNKKKGKYIDLGCFHPLMYSNTCLLYKKGWMGMNIDMNPTSIDLFNILRPKDINICSAISNEKKRVKMFYDDPFSPLNTIDKYFYSKTKETFFKEKKIIDVKTSKINNFVYKIGNEVDFLNIDIEGLDYRILKDINFSKLKVKLIAVETHFTDGKKLKDCDKIYSYLKENKFYIYRRVGPTTLSQN